MQEVAEGEHLADVRAAPPRRSRRRKYDRVVDGAADPGSASSALLEVVTTFGALTLGVAGVYTLLPAEWTRSQPSTQDAVHATSPAAAAPVLSRLPSPPTSTPPAPTTQAPSQPLRLPPASHEPPRAHPPPPPAPWLPKPTPPSQGPGLPPPSALPITPPLPLMPPPPSPPPPPRISDPGALAEIINERFRRGAPSVDASACGVALHIFDYGKRVRAWEGCPSNAADEFAW